MKKFYLFILLLSFPMLSQNQFWTWQNPKPTGQDLNDAIQLSNGKILTFLTGGFVQSTTDNGATWSTIIADTNGEDIYEADFPTATTGYICGTSGLLMKSVDGGMSWSYLNSGTTSTLWFLDFHDENLGIACGASGVILRTSDGGATWTQITSPGSTTLYSVLFVNATTVYMTASSTTIGRLFKSTDGGLTFTNISANVPFVAASTVRGLEFFGENTGWISTSLYEVYKTTDAGATWALQVDLGTGTLYDIKFVDVNTGFMAGTNGQVFKTTDGGITWALQTVNAVENMYVLSVSPVASSEGSISAVLAAGRYGTLVKSNDLGANWSSLYTAATQEEVRDIFMVTPSLGYAGGGAATLGPTNGVVLKTTDGGNNWAVVGNTNYRNYSTFWLDADKGFMGSRGTYGVLKTTNGGVTWDSLNLAAGTATGLWYGLYFSDANNGLACGSSGLVIRTTDGGTTWTTSTSNFGTSVVYALKNIEPNKYIIVGSSGKYGISTDGGATFAQSVTPGSTSAVYDVDFFDTQTGWLVGSSGTIFKTTDGGTTWVEQVSGSTSTLYSVKAINATTAWVGGSGGTIIYTTDGGATWKRAPQVLGAISTSYGVASIGGYIWFTGTGGEIIQGFADPNIPVELASFSASVNEGIVHLNWQTATETNNQGFYVESSLDTKTWNQNGFIAGAGTTTEMREYSYSVPFNGTRNLYFRLRQMDFDGTFNYSNIIEVSLNPYEFSLSQNYPNPFNPATTINFTLPTPQNVSLDIFNSAGEKVATIVNESLQAGYHSINFNASKLSSGVYFYSIKAGDFVAVRKMILLK